MSSVQTPDPRVARFRRALGHVCGAALLTLPACLVACALAGGAPAAAAAARSARSPTVTVAGYPAGASRPQFHPRRSEFAPTPTPGRAGGRASSSGGAVAPSHSKSPTRRSRKPVLHGDPARALVAFQAMQKTYYVKASALYLGEPFSYLWAFSQAFAATVTMANIPHLGVSLSRELQARLAGLGSYLDSDNSAAPAGTYISSLPAFDGSVAPPAGPGGTKYFDDNDWIGLELLRVYRITHSTDLLARAEELMAFEMGGWQTSPELGCPGGIPFANTATNTERNTVTTAPAAELLRSSTASPATSSTSPSPRWHTNGCARASCSRAACMPTT